MAILEEQQDLARRLIVLWSDSPLNRGQPTLTQSWGCGATCPEGDGGATAIALANNLESSGLLAEFPHAVELGLQQGG